MRQDGVGAFGADDGGQFLARRAADAGEAAERREQRLAPPRTDAGNRSSSDRRSRIVRAWRWKVTAKRCASSRMRWISSSAGLVGRERDRIVAIAREEQLFLLRDADRDEVRQPELLERGVGGRQLSLAAVDQDQIGKRPAALEQLAIAAQHDFAASRRSR